MDINPLNVKLHTICHLLALLEAHHILHFSRAWVNVICCDHYASFGPLTLWISNPVRIYGNK